MTTPVWQPGTLYSPGSIVQPASALKPTPAPVANGDFESGDTAWTKDAGMTIGQFGAGKHFTTGTWSAQWDSTSTGRIKATTALTVVPGQAITASCMVQQGASSSGQAGGRVEIGWYTAADALVSYSPGNLVDKGSNQQWKQSTVTAVAPATAAKARIVGYAFRNSGSNKLWLDNFVWNLQVTALPAGLVFKATQAATGASGSAEPVWPVVLGGTVTDNEVTWEGVYASKVVWEASPILTSGSSEPTWPTLADGTIADGTIVWKAMNARVPGPQSPITAIAASKIFKGDDDIAPFSATANCLDWVTPNDAGYLPFGLQENGETPISAIGLYNTNLAIFNSKCYQMWQVDEDPANMALLDSKPMPCDYKGTVQPVMNDLLVLTAVGLRNIGVAGASTNLQAGFFGKQVDPLVLPLLRAAIAAGFEPFALFYPAAGQYWCIFGSEAVVLTMNGGPKDASWSRYTFPSDITDWTIHGTDLYLRSGDIVWKVSDEALMDDSPLSGATGGTVTFTSATIAGIAAPNAVGVLTTTFPNFIGSPVTGTASGTVISGTIAGYSVFGIATDTASGTSLTVGLRVPTADLRATPQSAYFTTVNIPATVDVPAVTSGALNVSASTFSQTTDGSDTLLRWVWFLQGGSTPRIFPGFDYVAIFEPESAVGVPFDGYMAWPYLDFGVIGADKELESFEVVFDGTLTLSVGWNQGSGNEALATTPYTIVGDTVDGTPMPLPMTAPSFQFRLTFPGSLNQDDPWEWQALGVNLS